MADMTTKDDDRRAASLNHAELLLSAAINLARLGKRKEAVSLFEGAQKRFENFNEIADAGIARAWAEGLKKRLYQDGMLAPHS
jgi:hypothetical protein